MLIKIKYILIKIYLYISRIYFYGKKYKCPCCNKRFRKFKNFNYKRPLYNKTIYTSTYKNTICPYCLSLPRHRIICEYLNNNMHLIKNKKVLLFAAERSIKKWLKNKNIEYTTADLYKKADLKIDIMDINLSNNVFDVVICNHVLEHVKDYKKAIAEINRILTKEGIFICSMPIDTTLKETINISKEETADEKRYKYGQADHYRNFGLNIKEDIEILRFYSNRN